MNKGRLVVASKTSDITFAYKQTEKFQFCEAKGKNDNPSIGIISIEDGHFFCDLA
jgi:hypothetical protein